MSDTLYADVSEWQVGWQCRRPEHHLAAEADGLTAQQFDEACGIRADVPNPVDLLAAETRPPRRSKRK
jgi:hypothetical protein